MKLRRLRLWLGDAGGYFIGRILMSLRINHHQQTMIFTELLLSIAPKILRQEEEESDNLNKGETTFSDGIQSDMHRPEIILEPSRSLSN